MSGSTLKLIAILSMLIDHIAVFILAGLSYKDMSISLLGVDISCIFLMRGFGRIAFPLFAFLLVEGFIHTHNRWKYGLCLLVFAFISELSFDLLHPSTVPMMQQNIFFTLFLGYLGMVSHKYFQKDIFNQTLSFLILGGMAWLIRCDYGVCGFLFIMIMYIMREEKIIKALVGCWVLPNSLWAALSCLPILFYNGKRGFINGKIAKYFFYLFYPGHLTIIYLLKQYIIR